MKADNKTKTLKTDSNADLIFKKGDYIHTYVVIETNGLPNGATLYLLDESLNQLYSPYDVNANQVKTPCTIIVGEIDALQLPANYIEDEYTDFDVGTYHWNLKYHDVTGKTFENKTIPVTIQIVDFDLETDLTPKIFPNQNIQIQLKTWVYTNPSSNDIDINRLTTNAVYDNTTGIITYPNNDINDLTIGQHTQIVNQYQLDYTVKNPIKAHVNPQKDAFYHNKIVTSGSNHSLRSIGIKPAEYDTGSHYYPVGGVKNFTKICINGIQKSTSGSTGTIYDNDKYVEKRIHIYNLPPGTYNYTVEGNTTECDNITYTDSITFEITTQDCTLSTEQKGINFISKYIYNTTIPIPNATLGLINTSTNTLIDTQTTDSNGECIWDVSSDTYKVVALDYDDTILLESESFTVPEIVLTKNKDIIKKGESVTLTAKSFKENNVNQEIIFTSNALEDTTINNSGTHDFGEYFILDFSNLPAYTSSNDFLQIGDNTNNMKIIFYEYTIKVELEENTIWYSKNDVFFFDNDKFYSATTTSTPKDISFIDKTQWNLNGNVDSIPISMPFIRTVNTDSNGIATTNYTGKGDGFVNITAKHGQTNSNEIQIEDCIYLDDFTSDTVTRYYTATGDLLINDNKMTYTFGGSRYINLQTQNSNSTLNLSDYQGKTVNCEIHTNNDENMEIAIITYDQNYNSSVTSSALGVNNLTVTLPSDMSNISFRCAFENVNTGDSVDINMWKISFR